MRPDLTEEERAQVLARRKWWEKHKHEWGTEAGHLAERMQEQTITNAYLREHPENIRLLGELQAMTDAEREAFQSMTDEELRAKFPWYYAARDADPE